MVTTINDIARAVGVSRSTVARALAGKYGVSPETVALIKKTAEELNYRPNYAARTLAVGRSQTVGIVAAPSVIWTLQETVGSTESRLSDAGYSMLFYAVSGRPGGERACLEQLMYDRVAGVMAVPSSDTSDTEIYQELVDSGIKLLVVNSFMPNVRAPQVVTDDYQAAYQATQHLISLGHRSIVYMAFPNPGWSRTERVRAFTDAMNEAGTPVSPSSIIDVPFNQSAGYRAMSRLLESPEQPTAVYVHHDVVAMGCLQAVLAAGLSVPDDISVVGDGDVWFNSMLEVPITTLHYPLEEMLRIGTEKLLDMLAGQQVDEGTTVLSAELIPRLSSGSVQTSAHQQAPNHVETTQNHWTNLTAQAKASSVSSRATNGTGPDAKTEYYLEWSRPVSVRRVHFTGGRHEMSSWMLYTWNNRTSAWEVIINGTKTAVVDHTFSDGTVPITARLRLEYTCEQCCETGGLSELAVYGTADAYGVLSGIVIEGGTGRPVPGAKIEVDTAAEATKSDEQGDYRLKLPSGSYSITASAKGYITATVLDVAVIEYETLDITLTPIH